MINTCTVASQLPASQAAPHGVIVTINLGCYHGRLTVLAPSTTLCFLSRCALLLPTSDSSVHIYVYECVSVSLYVCIYAYVCGCI